LKGKFVKKFLILIAALALGLFAFTKSTAPARQLDVIDSYWSGDAKTERVAEGVTFDAANGLKLDVWSQPNESKTPKPVLIFYYGGGWANGERWHYGFAARAYAAKGFVVVVPDYRKVPQVRFPVFNQDAAEAVKWARDNVAKYGGDPDRIAVAGHSAGAYIAVMMALDGHYLSDIGVDPKIIRAGVGLSGPYDFLPFDSKRSINAMRRWPRPLETQPVTYVRRDAPPLLLVTGTADDTVKPRNAMILTQRLNAAGAVVSFKAYEGLSHEDVVAALSNVFRSKAPVLDDSAAFLIEHTQPQP
jgi:acetyl esterase/lipase